MSAEPAPLLLEDGGASSPTSDAMGPPAVPFILALGHALHRFGAPAHRLEEAMARISERLGLQGQFFTTPTAIIAAFGPFGAQATSLIRVESAEVHLEKLAELDRLSEDLERGRIGLHDAEDRIERIVSAPVRFRRTLAVLSHGLVSAGAARFLGGALAEVVLAFCIGTITGALSVALTRVPTGVRLYELAAAFAATLAAHLVARFVHPVAPYIATLAGIITLLPGLTLTVAMTELATRNLVSGSARLTAAAIAFLEIIFGVALADRVANALFGEVAARLPEALPPWTEAVALGITFPGLLVLFRAPLAAWWAILLVELLAFFGARGGALLLGKEIGISLGAFLVGLAGNAFSRWRRQPSAVVVMPGLLMLVPGTVGFRSLFLLLEQDPVSALSAGFSMLLGAVAIVAGLLVANLALSPRRPL
jgi:uncharacterized membrane protein YjjP (DUF1212 family)